MWILRTQTKLLHVLLASTSSQTQPRVWFQHVLVGVMVLILCFFFFSLFILFLVCKCPPFTGGPGCEVACEPGYCNWNGRCNIDKFHNKSCACHDAYRGANVSHNHPTLPSLPSPNLSWLPPWSLYLDHSKVSVPQLQVLDPYRAVIEFTRPALLILVLICLFFSVIGIVPWLMEKSVMILVNVFCH